MNKTFYIIVVLVLVVVGADGMVCGAGGGAAAPSSAIGDAECRCVSALFGRHGGAGGDDFA